MLWRKAFVHCKAVALVSTNMCTHIMIITGYVLSKHKQCTSGKF